MTHTALGYAGHPRPFEHLANLHATHGRLGPGDDPADLFEAYRDCVQLLEERGTIAEAAIRDLDLLDVAQLTRRSPAAMPEIVVSAEITSKKNLSVRWMPFLRDDGSSTYRRPPDDETPIGGRPDNELMFIHNARWLTRDPDRSHDAWHTDPFWSQIKADLTAAIAGLFARMLERLDALAHVYCLDMVGVITDPPAAPGQQRPSLGQPAPRVRRLEVFHLETRDLERMVDELATVFPSEIALADFQSIAGPYTGPAGASRALKKRGYTSMTPTRVSRLAWMHDEAVFHGILPGTRLGCGAIHDAPIDPRSVRHLIAPRPLKHSVAWPGDPNP